MGKKTNLKKLAQNREIDELVKQTLELMERMKEKDWLERYGK